MSRRTLVALLVLGSWSVAASGQSSCMPEYTALNVVERVVPLLERSFVHSLRSMNGAGDMFSTRVQVEGRVSVSARPIEAGVGDVSVHLNQASVSSEASLDLTVQFDPAFGGVSLPYNLYAILVISDGRVLTWLDFTDSCRSSGVSFFPGREVRIPSVKLIGVDPQTLQIMVWGRM